MWIINLFYLKLTERIEVIYSGRVQGFKFNLLVVLKHTACSLSLSLIEVSAVVNGELLRGLEIPNTGLRCVWLSALSIRHC